MTTVTTGRQLGRGGPNVAPFALGTMTFGLNDEDRCQVNHWDTLNTH